MLEQRIEQVDIYSNDFRTWVRQLDEERRDVLFGVMAEASYKREPLPNGVRLSF